MNNAVNVNYRQLTVRLSVRMVYNGIALKRWLYNTWQKYTVMLIMLIMLI